MDQQTEMKIGKMKKQLASSGPDDSPCPDCGEWSCSHHVSEYWRWFAFEGQYRPKNIA
jgi:hypothetical protein